MQVEGRMSWLAYVIITDFGQSYTLKMSLFLLKKGGFGEEGGRPPRNSSPML